MTRRLTGSLLGLLAFAGSASARRSGHGQEGRRQDLDHHHRRQGIRSRDPRLPTYSGDTGLFHLSSAYTLPKGKASFSLFRDNLDRDPKDIDISIHGLTVGYGATHKLEIFGSIGVQNRVNTDAPLPGRLLQRLPLRGQPDVSRSWQTGFGDVKLGAKYKILDDYNRDGSRASRCKAT